MILLFALLTFICGFCLGIRARGWRFTQVQFRVLAFVIIFGIITVLFYPKAKTEWTVIHPTWAENVMNPSYRLIADLAGSSFRMVEMKTLGITGGVLEASGFTDLRKRHSTIQSFKDSRCVIWLTDAEAKQIVFADGTLALCETTEMNGLWFVGIEDLPYSHIKTLVTFDTSVQNMKK